MRSLLLILLFLLPTARAGHPISLSDTSWPNLSANPLLSGLIHAWMLNEGGTNLTSADRVGSNPLTLQSGAAWNTNAGQVGVLLTGANWLDSTAWSSGNASNISVIVWCLYSNTPASAMLVTKEVVNGQWQLDFPGSAFRFFAGTNTTVGSFVGPNSFPITNAWHQIGGIFTANSNILFYVNGADDSNLFPPSGVGNDPYPDSATVMNVGRYSSFGGGFYFSGVIGPIYIYNRRLSPAEVGQLYTNKYLF